MGMRKPESHFVDAVAEIAEDTSSSPSSIDDILDGAVSLARWEDACYMTRALLTQLAHGNLGTLRECGETAVALTGGGAGEEAAVAAAIVHGEKGAVDSETGALHLRNLVGFVVSLSRTLARVEDCRPSEVVGWSSGHDLPAHWERFLR